MKPDPGAAVRDNGVVAPHRSRLIYNVITLLSSDCISADSLVTRVLQSVTRHGLTR